MYRITALVRRKEGLNDNVFSSRWFDVLAPAISTFLRKDESLRRLVVNVAPDKLDDEVAKIFPPPFDGLIEFWFGDADEAIKSMKELSSNEELCAIAEGIVDGPAGVAWLAKVVPSKPEQGSNIKFLAAGDVAEGMSLADAHAYWKDVHPVVARTAPKVWNKLTRYTQFHGVQMPKLEIGGWLAKARFVPMCSDMGFARQRDFVDVYTSDEYVSIVRPDEEKFSRPGEMLSFISAEERDLV